MSKELANLTGVNASSTEDLFKQLEDKNGREVRIIARNLLAGKSLGTNKAMKIAVILLAREVLQVAAEKYMEAENILPADVAKAVKELGA
jgi:hypothetical protein